MSETNQSSADKLTTEALTRAALDPERYPDRTAFIAADAGDFAAMLEQNVQEHRPIAVVYPDGREVIATPAAGLFALFLGRLLGLVRERVERRRAERTGAENGHGLSVIIPPDYRVEIRSPERLAA